LVFYVLKVSIWTKMKSINIMDQIETFKTKETKLKPKINI
jgi:hypothetical protein